MVCIDSNLPFAELAVVAYDNSYSLEVLNSIGIMVRFHHAINAICTGA